MQILGVKIDCLAVKEVLDRVHQYVGGATQHYLVSVNPEGVVLAQKDGRYRDIVNSASLGLMDGIGTVWAMRIFSKKIKADRITGIDLMLALCESAARGGWRIYLVGGTGETARIAAERLRMKYPGLIIDGEEGMPYGENFQFPISNFQTIAKFQIPNSKFLHDERSHYSHLIQRINNFKPQLLFVALGQPKQEFWIDAHLKELPSVKIAMGVGGAFDFIAGKVRRAPRVLRAVGLEWLWRVTLQPWRLPRILNATVRFMWLVVHNYFSR